jgi:hypothetical protein
MNIKLSPNINLISVIMDGYAESSGSAAKVLV